MRKRTIESSTIRRYFSRAKLHVKRGMDDALWPSESFHGACVHAHGLAERVHAHAYSSRRQYVMTVLQSKSRYFYGVVK